jgi:uncharacterized protein (DUF2336 family)
MTAELSFMKEMENAIAGASTSRRGEMARKVTDLFVGRSDEFSADDLAVFDDVVVRLATEIEEHARALLSRRLAPIRNAPPRIIRLLARDDDIEVAGPVLAQSAQLSDEALVEIARTKGQAHMLAIAQRGSLSEVITDVLVELGDREVVLNAVDNYGANFSDHGFTVLVRRSEGDDMLTEFVGARPEIPSPLLTVLVAKASAAVRTKLEATHPRAKAAVHRAVAEAAGRVEAQVASTALDYTAALKAVEGLRQSDVQSTASIRRAGHGAGPLGSAHGHRQGRKPVVGNRTGNFSAARRKGRDLAKRNRSAPGSLRTAAIGYGTGDCAGASQSLAGTRDFGWVIARVRTMVRARRDGHSLGRQHRARAIELC